jgi:tetratricopeptide (TPR) repeat protein
VARPERAGQVDDAIAHCQRAVELRPDLPIAQFSLTRALVAGDLLAEAIERYQAALALEPGYVEARKALVLASQANQGGLADVLRVRLKTYGAHRPLRQTAGESEVPRQRP